MIQGSVIYIEDLLLRCIIGINDEEKRDKQDILINIKVLPRLNGALQSNQISDTVNYRSICKRVIKIVEQDGPFELLEHLANLILQTILNEFDVDSATVKVAKPYALRFARSVAIELTGNNVSIANESCCA